jgi:hypothetical protein
MAKIDLEAEIESLKMEILNLKDTILRLQDKLATSNRLRDALKDFIDEDNK